MTEKKVCGDIHSFWLEHDQMKVDFVSSFLNVECQVDETYDHCYMMQTVQWSDIKLNFIVLSASKPNSQTSDRTSLFKSMMIVINMDKKICAENRKICEESKRN